MRESKDITREELLSMVGTLRGALFIGDPPLRDLSDRELDEMQEEYTQLYNETAFDLSEREGDVKTAAEKISSLEAQLTEAKELIEKNKESITTASLKRFARSAADLCLNIETFGRKLVDSLNEVCEECPHRQDVPCAACKLIETHEMSAEEREAQRRSFAHGNAAMHNPNVTQELIDQEAEKMKAEKMKAENPEVP